MVYFKTLSPVLYLFAIILFLSYPSIPLAQTCTDLDGDGYGLNGDASCTNAGIDCDDTDPDVHPDAPRKCDAKDSDCDGYQDFFTDRDSDNDGVPMCAGDCDDSNANRYPGNQEGPFGHPSCGDGVDNDCDYRTDGGDMQCMPGCTDSDGDGYGNPGNGDCPNGSATDCNDSNAAINPGAADDDCDNVDDNCSGAADDEYLPTVTNCGIGECAATGTLSCVAGVEDDSCTAGSPAKEGPAGDATCTDTFDNDCDGLTDSSDLGCTVTCLDDDGDGYGHYGDATCPNPGVDCNDDNAAINPGATDSNCDNVDDNCSGTADDEYVPTVTNCGIGECATTGQLLCNVGDLEDNCTALSPDTEGPFGDPSCSDTLDNDCDTVIDGDDNDCNPLDQDNDADGYCEGPGCSDGSTPGDCDDTDPLTYPGAPRLCDAKDNDCDTWQDFFTDKDGDGDGVPLCGGDCNDADPNRYPGALEGPFGDATCADSIDNDCDYKIDLADNQCKNVCTDSDGDGYGNPGHPSCTNGSATDCDDSDPLINPGADDSVCNFDDDDCDGTADDEYVPYPETCGIGICERTVMIQCIESVAPQCQPGLPEKEGALGNPTCSDALDNDCDGLTDSSDVGCTVTCLDDDGDGYGYYGDASCPNAGVDCNDDNPAIHPGAPDDNCDNVDDNCSGIADDEYAATATNCGIGECSTTGQLVCVAGALDDTCTPLTPGVEDYLTAGVCTDTVDNDCDGLTDTFDVGCNPPDIDNDADGYCEGPLCQGGVIPGDCDDTDATVHPGGDTTACDGKDTNCDGWQDFFTDKDSDADGVPLCGGDCNDSDSNRYPGNQEGPRDDPTCSDGIDNDCDNKMDDADADCAPPTCGTKIGQNKDGPHMFNLLDGGNNVLKTACQWCHFDDSGTVDQRRKCERCHADVTWGGPDDGTLKALYSASPPYGFGTATNVRLHSSTVLGTKYGAWDMDCLTCHNPHLQEQDSVHGTTYGKYIKEFICFDNTATGGGSFEDIVEFTASSGTGSFADGPPYNENICEMCHTQTDYHRRDGTAPPHEDSKDCMVCHSHTKGFKRGGTDQSHTTHLISIKGPQLTCTSEDLGCHGNQLPPSFLDGNDLASTTVCDNCHSPGGVIDGVNDPAIGAKPNWENGIYDDRVLQVGKEMWCTTCHDDSPANSRMNGYGVSAANVVGDNSTFGFYVTGHGQNIQIDCITCHDVNSQHIDHEFVHLLDNSEKDKVFNLTDYRFYQGKRLEIKHHNSVPDKFRLCFTCHEETWVTDTVTPAPDLETNFRKDNYTLIHGMFNNGNLHAYHTAITSCSTCHNVHGLTLDTSQSLVPTFTRMMREWAGSYVNLTYDSVTDKYYELTDPAKWNDPVYNQGGASTSPLYCGSCHGYTDLTNGVGPDETYVMYGAPWYLRTYKPHTYSVVFDMDSDGLTDNIDNCPAVANIDQADADIDYVGDACDTCPNDPINDADVDGLCGDVDICPYDKLDDYDGDGICGDIDNCDAHSNPLQADSDEDGFGDICDNCVDMPNPDQANYDGDMLGDVCDDTCSAYVQLSMNLISLPSILSGAGTVYDSVGNIYFAGTTDADLAGQIGLADMVLIKYDVSGSPVWTRQFGTAGADYTFEIVIDPSDNLLILGRDDASNVVVVKYDSAGNQHWTVQTPGVVRDIAVDDSGNVYVSTHRQHDYGVIKYDTDGNELWRQHVNATFRDYALTLAVDDAENVYLGGVSQVGYYDFYIIKFDTNGIHQWTTTLDPGDEWTYVHDIAADTEGNTYVTGTARGNFANISTDWEQHYTLKLDPAGNHLWTRQVAQSVIGGAEKISIDNTGNIYVTDYGLDLISYDPDGNQRFASHFTVPDHSATFGLIYDSAQLTYLTGIRDNVATGSQELFIMNVGGQCQQP